MTKNNSTQFNHLKQYAQERYAKREHKLAQNAIVKFRLIAEYVGTGRRILDIGCGDSFLSRMIEEKGNIVFGIDLIHEKLKAASADGIKCVASDLQGFHLPFQSSSFDVVVASEIIEHLWDCDFFLQEIKRVLKEKGQYIITTPNLASLGRRLMLLFGKNPFVENFLYSNEAGHVKHFVRDDLAYLLKRNGFIVEKITSDVVVFSNRGRLFSAILAQLIPSLGRSLIAIGKKE